MMLKNGEGQLSMTRETPWGAIFLMIVCLGAAGAIVPAALATEPSKTDTDPGSSSATLKDRHPRYQLHKSDTFELEFTLSPEFNQSVSVQPDGYITLKAVGTIYAEGLTLTELTERIRQAYAGVLHDPVITIELKDFDKPYFIASGQIGKPGKYDLRSDLTVTQAVAVAGGFTDSSQRTQVVLFRPATNGMTEAKLLNIKKMLNSRNLDEDIHLQPGDMIYVPQNRISKISKYLPTANMGLYGAPVL